jgi:anti-sigma-K factor RskA
MSSQINPPDPQMDDLIAAYAVDALDEDERAYVEARLDDHPSYRSELERHLETLASLTVDEPVPQATWDMVRARTVGQVSRTTDPAPPVSAPVLSSPTPVNPQVANVIALDAARAARRSRLRVGIGAAAAAVVFAVPTTLQFAGGPSSPSLAALATEAAKEPNARSVSLKTPDGADLAQITLTADGRGYLRSDTLAALPAGQTYQLWAITGAAPVSAGLLGADPGIVAFTVAAPASALALSIEPTAGSTQPTSTPIAIGELT